MKDRKECRIMTKFKENVVDALNERNISIKDFCEQAGFGKNMIYELDQHLPTLKNAIIISNILDLSLDFLLGRTEEQQTTKIKDTASFVSNLEKLINAKDISKLKFCNDLNFSTDCFTRWRRGALPYLSKIVEISDYFNCSIDDLLETCDRISRWEKKQ